MEEPPDICKRGRKEVRSEFLIALKNVRATKATLSRLESLKKNDWRCALEEFQEARHSLKSWETSIDHRTCCRCRDFAFLP
jgi:hypothetical protein